MSGACAQCLRRAWLLERLGVSLDFRAHELTRFWGLLELSDRELIQSLGGRRRAQLREEHERWTPPLAEPGEGIATMCVHHRGYPGSLCNDALAPRALSVRGGMERLAGLLEREVVAIVGTRRASDYGMETARSLSRGLAACGVTVASTFGEGIPSAVYAGALEGGGQTLAVMAGGVGDCSPAWCRALYRRILHEGCAISELVRRAATRPRRWWRPACGRTLALVAHLVIVVEAEDHPWELACAEVAQMRAIPVAAVPGRVSSPASAGANRLLMGGAKLVRGPQDALDALYGVGVRDACRASAGNVVEGAKIEPRLARVLELVGNGHDTAAKLARHTGRENDIAMALFELELAGLVVRGDGGRYLPSAHAAAA